MTHEESGERFEKQLGSLEQIVTRLEDEAVGLEEALELFERGMVLARSCRQRLEQIEHKVALLLESHAGEGATTRVLEEEGP